MAADVNKISAFVSASNAKVERYMREVSTKSAASAASRGSELFVSNEEVS